MEQQHRRCFAPTTTGHRAVGLEEEDVDALYIIDEKDSFCEDVKIHLKKRERSEKADATTASTATTGTLETYKRSTSTLDFLL